MMEPSPGTRSFSVKAAAIGLFVVLQICLLFIIRHDTLELDVHPNTVPSPNIRGIDRVGQTFTFRGGGPARIDVMLGTHSRANDREVVFRLKEGGPDGRTIAEVPFNAAGVANNLYRTFRFRALPAPGTEGRYFELESRASTDANSIAVWMNGSDIYPGGERFHNGLPVPGDLVFRAYARRTLWAGLPRVARGGSGPMRSVLALAAALLLFEALSVLLLARLIDRFRKG